MALILALVGAMLVRIFDVEMDFVIMLVALYFFFRECDK